LNHGDRILDHIPLEIAGIVRPELARREGVDPDPQLTNQLADALRGITTGQSDLRQFTPAMRTFLSTATARGLGEWIAWHGALAGLRHAQTEPAGTHRVLWYRAVAGGAELWFSSRSPQTTRLPRCTGGDRSVTSSDQR
jgi:hypothetical protein